MSNSPKPLLLLDQHFRTISELFREEVLTALKSMFDVHGGYEGPMDRNEFLSWLPATEVIVAAKPEMDATELALAKNLRAVIEVSGTFQDGLDYDYCFKNGIEVLSCSPGFCQAVAEMTLGLLLAGCRGIVEEHERMRIGEERWLDDHVGRDFTLHRQSIGFVGFGEIARECTRLLEPFSPTIKVFDPWISSKSASLDRVGFCELEELFSTCRAVIVAASPTDENYRLVSKSLIDRLPSGAVVVLASRAHVVDFDALVGAANSGKIRFAADVFPSEPLEQTSLYRSAGNVIWSPHRAAAVDGGRQPIGDMILRDCKNILNGHPGRSLKAADRSTVYHIIRAPLVTDQSDRRSK